MQLGALEIICHPRLVRVGPFMPSPANVERTLQLFWPATFALSCRSILHVTAPTGKRRERAMTVRFREILLEWNTRIAKVYQDSRSRTY